MRCVTAGDMDIDELGGMPVCAGKRLYPRLKVLPMAYGLVACLVVVSNYSSTSGQRNWCRCSQPA